MHFVICPRIYDFFLFKQRADPPPAPPGGEKVVNVTDPRVIKASMAGIEAINLQNGYGETALREVISKVKNATEQVCDRFHTVTRAVVTL